MLVHDRATPLARRRTPEAYLEMRARIACAGLQDDRAGGATTSDLVAGLRAAIKMRDDEIAALRARAVAGTVHDSPRGRPFDAATGMPSFAFETSKLGIDRACRSAVAATIVSEAVRDRNEAYVSAVFDTLTAMTSGGRFDPSPSLIALQARDDAISNAWKPEVAKADPIAARVATSRFDSDSAHHLIEPRDGDGRWTAAGSSRTIPDVGASSSVRGTSIGGYGPSMGMPVSNYNGDPEQAGVRQRTAAVSTSPVTASLTERLQIAYPDGWQACHEKCLQETEHMRGSGRPLVYRRCVRKCLGPDADY